MGNSSVVRELLWEERQRADRAQRDVEHREWLMSFALVFALIVLTLAIASLFAGLGGDLTIRL